MAAAAFTSASGTGDATVRSERSTLMGVIVNESAATAAAAEVVIRDGTDATGAEVLRLQVAADESDGIWLGPQGVRCNNGIFIDRTAGTTIVTVYHN